MVTESAEHKSEGKKITRLDFLKLAGAAGAVGATLPSLMPFGQVLGSNSTNNNTNTNQMTSNMRTTMNKQSSSVHNMN